jgi:RNA polymerase sigma-70 factor, ECF subfamily
MGVECNAHDQRQCSKINLIRLSQKVCARLLLRQLSLAELPNHRGKNRALTKGSTWVEDRTEGSRVKLEGGHIVSADLRVSATILDQEGQRTLKLEERITQIYDELYKPVYRYLLCRNASPGDADDIIQETFLRLYRHLNAGGREDNLRGWVFRVAHNISISELKRRKHLLPIAPEELAEFEVSHADPAPGPEELLIRREEMARVHDAISTLSEQQKQCLYLRAEGFRYREIAEILEVTISTVAESLRRAIKKLIGESRA